MRRNRVAAVILISIAPPARGTDTPPQASPAVTKLLGCRALEDADRRLACFDREATIVAGEIDGRRLVVVDRAQVLRVQRERFGLAAPGLDLFADKDGRRLAQVTTTVAGGGVDPFGKWVITLADGSRWHQIDDFAFNRSPHPGQPATISRAAIGSFKMSIAGQSAIRVRRER